MVAMSEFCHGCEGFDSDTEYSWSALKPVKYLRKCYCLGSVMFMFVFPCATHKEHLITIYSITFKKVN